MTIIDIKKQVLKECKDENKGVVPCSGNFFTIETEVGVGEEEGQVFKVIKDCACRQKLNRRVKSFIAGIDKRFWDFDWEDIESDFDASILKELEYFRNNLSECVNNKVQFFFNGTVGSGKTIISSLLLREVLLYKEDNTAVYDGFIIKSFDLLKLLYSKKEEDYDEMQNYRDASFLVIDEIDKLNGRDRAINDFCAEVVSYMDNKSLILLSNDSIAGLKKQGYPLYFIDRLKSTKNITFKGDSFRSGRNVYDNLKEE